MKLRYSKAIQWKSVISLHWNAYLNKTATSPTPPLTWPMFYPSTKFYENHPGVFFCYPADRHTGKQTNTLNRKHNLLGGGNNQSLQDFVIFRNLWEILWFLFLFKPHLNFTYTPHTVNRKQINEMYKKKITDIRQIIYVSILVF